MVLEKLWNRSSKDDSLYPIVNEAIKSPDYLLRQCAIKGSFAVESHDQIIHEATDLAYKIKKENSSQKRLEMIQRIRGIVEFIVEGGDDSEIIPLRSVCIELMDCLESEKQSLVRCSLRE